MSRLSDTIKNLKDRLAEGLDGALKRMGEVLLDTSGKYNDYVHLKARYEAYLSAVLLDIASKAELDKTYNNLLQAALLLIDKLKDEDLKPEPETPTATGRRGELLYHIPHEMQERREYRCAVRVAYLKELLYEGWKKQAGDEQKNIRVAEVMSVELLNQREDEPFTIRALSDAVQFLDADEYTEWVFYVKAHQTGSLPLVLRVVVLEIRNGREVKKDVVIEQRVIVSTEAQEPLENFERSKENLLLAPPPQAGTGVHTSTTPGSRNLRAMALFLVFLMLGSATFAFPEQRDWVITRYVQNDAAAYDKFLQKYPKSAHKETAVYRKAIAAPSLPNVHAYLNGCATGEFSGYYKEEMLRLLNTQEEITPDTLQTVTTPPRIVQKQLQKEEEKKSHISLQTPPSDSDIVAIKYPKKTLEAQSNVNLNSNNASFVGSTSFNEGNMIFVKGGTFSMGCTLEQGDECEADEKPVHVVTLSDYYISKYEVTNAEYAAFLNDKGRNGENGALWIKTSGIYKNEKCRIFQEGNQYHVEAGYENDPVIYVSWFGAISYCNWLGKATNKIYRLPTEAEWEYAARSRAPSQEYRYSGNNNLNKVGWFKSNASGKTHPVGGLKANELGLMDMSGNVREWCNDWYASDYYSNSISNNPQGADVGSYRVVRGGSWANESKNCRSTNRYSLLPTFQLSDVGFRLARTP